MFSVTFYKNLSVKRVVSKNLETIKTIENCVYKEDSTILNTNIIVSYDTDIIQSNYCYISDNNRYYYITEKTKLSGGKILLNCNIDVLMSNKDELLQLTATVDRNQNESNAYLIDNNYKALAYKEIVCKSFPSGMTKDSIILMTVG